MLITLDQHGFDQAEALARQIHDDAGVGNMLTELGHVAEARGELDGALTLFTRALATTRQSLGENTFVAAYQAGAAPAPDTIIVAALDTTSA